MVDGPVTLQDLYWQQMMEGYVSLEDFLDRLAAGEFGSFPGDEVIRFLREIESDIMANIGLKAEENPSAADAQQDVAEETHERIAALIAKYGRHG